ncbi:nitroreductase family deazaflavin-dependent oxidoreductase [Skermania sp. ID1734]|uniref:nitroreductase/quinone reductase family protein n=1 Tax=Skermania sp. ID1734 TaxID=2597516 RepID=UPI001181686F|nr:nitroreductase/quinone reductase family protein [Skermania sp. ID1734]TSD94406.1 nitroreductase family deazaflavin-dependent oxidoreductase [Skermania sp. ID1734]
MTDSPFPDVRWGSESSKLRKPATAFAGTKFGSWTIRTLTPLDRRLLRRSRGRYTMLGPIGAPTMLLTTTGRKSGQPRTTPLLYVRDGNRLIVVGSNFGQDQHPAWTSNLLADPNAIVTIGGKDVAVTATQLAGDEKAAAYKAFIDMVSVYDTYRNRTDRDIRVFALSPA